MTEIPSTLKRWVDAVNSQNLDTLASLMTPRYSFFVEGETPTQGVQRNRAAWHGYFTSFPDYRIHIDEAFGRPDAWYLVGHTQGSHVPAEQEAVPSSVIWRAVLEGDQLSEWSIYPASDDNRRRFNLPIGGDA